MTDYEEKLKHPLWQKKRLEILERDNWTCQSCLSKENTLHVHHLKYVNFLENPWDYPNYLLVTYCEICHKTEHLIGKIIRPDLIHIIESKPLLIRPIAQLCILSEKWPDFYEKLKEFLNESIIEHYKSLQSKTDG